MSASETDPSNDRLAILESENSRLRAELLEREHPQTRGRATVRAPLRHTVAALLGILGIALLPVGIIGAYVSDELRDTDRFVETFAPLASDPEIQKMVVDAVVTYADEAIGIDALVAEALAALRDTDISSRAASALELLEGPAANGIRSGLTTVTERVVASDAFAATWSQALRLSHAQMIGALESSDSTSVVLGDDGTIGLRLGPIIDQVREQLVSSGVGIASTIPDLDLTIDLVQSDEVARAALLYPAVISLGAWSPWVAIGLIACAVAVSVRRVHSLMVVAFLSAAWMVVVLLLLDVGRGLVQRALVSTDVTPGAAAAIYDTSMEFVRTTAEGVTVLAVAVGVVALVCGPARSGRAARRALRATASRLTTWIDPRLRWTTGPGTAIDRLIVPLRVCLLVGLVGLMLAIGAPTTRSVVVVTGCGLVVVACLEVIRRPDLRAVHPSSVDDGPGRGGCTTPPHPSSPVPVPASSAAAATADGVGGHVSE